MTVVDLTVKVVCKGALEQDIKQEDFDIMDSIFCDKEIIESKIHEYVLDANDNYKSEDLFVEIVDAKVVKNYPKVNLNT